MSVIKSNIDQMENDLSSIKQSIGDIQQLYSPDIASAIASIRITSIGGQTITQKEYDALTDKTGLFYIIDAPNSPASTLLSDAAILANKLSNQETILGNTDISRIHDGTITGSLFEMCTKICHTWIVDIVSQETYDALEDNTGVYHILGTTDTDTKLITTVENLASLMGDTPLSDTVTNIIQLVHKVSDGKKLIAQAIQNKGVYASETSTFAELAAQIEKIMYEEVLQESKTVQVGPNTSVIPDSGFNGLLEVIVSLALQSKTVSIGTTAQTIKADTGYALSSVTVNPLTGTATASDVLSGDVFHSSNGINISGSMVNHSGETLTASDVTTDGTNVNISIPEPGYYDTTSRIKISRAGVSSGDVNVLAVDMDIKSADHKYVWVDIDTSGANTLTIQSGFVSNGSNEGAPAVGVYETSDSDYWQIIKTNTDNTYPMIVNVSAYSKVRVRGHGYGSYITPKINLSCLSLS